MIHPMKYEFERLVIPSLNATIFAVTTSDVSRPAGCLSNNAVSKAFDRPSSSTAGS
jgi:hypothetical protein